MSIQPDTHIINSILIQLYEWIIIDVESYNPTTIGVIATSIEQARNLLLGELERQLPFANGIAVADINFTGPWTSNALSLINPFFQNLFTTVGTWKTVEQHYKDRPTSSFQRRLPNRRATSFIIPILEDADTTQSL